MLALCDWLILCTKHFPHSPGGNGSTCDDMLLVGWLASWLVDVVASGNNNYGFMTCDTPEREAMKAKQIAIPFD